MLKQFTQAGRLFGLFMAVLGAFVLSACGGDEGDGGSGGPGSAGVPDACTLISTAEAENALGGGATASGSVDEQGLFSLCNWINANTGAMLTLNIWASGSPDDGWAEQFLSGQTAGPDAVAVTGIGDEAYIALNEGRGSLVWRKGGSYVIALNATGTALTEADLTALGRTVDGGF